MKQIVHIVLCCLMLSLVLSGCSGLYNPIPKDTVMIKTLEAKEQFKANDEALLSEETIKTLSLNAVKKYYGHQLSLENVNIELIGMEHSDLKALLASTTSYLNLDQDILDAYILQLNNASGGLYFAKITNLFNEYDAYGVTINPINGDILGVAKADQLTDIKLKEPSSSSSDEELIMLAQQFIEQKEIVNAPIDSSSINIQNLSNGLSDLYYISEDRQILFHCTINRKTKEVNEFSKDVLAAIQMAALIAKYN